MISKISKLTVVSGTGVKQYEVGEDSVASIKDHGVEWGDHIDFIFKVYDEKHNLLAEIINCPTDISYYI